MSMHKSGSAPVLCWPLAYCTFIRNCDKWSWCVISWGIYSLILVFIVCVSGLWCEFMIEYRLSKRCLTSLITRYMANSSLEKVLYLCCVLLNFTVKNKTGVFKESFHLSLCLIHLYVWIVLDILQFHVICEYSFVVLKASCESCWSMIFYLILKKVCQINKQLRTNFRS